MSSFDKMSKSGYLIDTSVLSAFAPGRPAMPADLDAWLRLNSDRLYVPCIAIAEIEQGIRKLRRAGGTARARRLSAWLDELLEHYSERILPLDAAISRLAGQISDQAIAVGRHPGFPDVAIAALALHSRLTILTRKTRHFTQLKITCVDPFEQLPH
jgi:predicted nucleic acid-binding protein